MGVGKEEDAFRLKKRAEELYKEREGRQN